MIPFRLQRAYTGIDSVSIKEKYRSEALDDLFTNIINDTFFRSVEPWLLPILLC